MSRLPIERPSGKVQLGPEDCYCTLGDPNVMITGTSPAAVPNYGSTANTTSPRLATGGLLHGVHPTGPYLPLYFTVRHEPTGGNWRTAIVSVIMCLIVVSADYRLLDWNILWFSYWVTEGLLMLLRIVFSDLTWSLIIGWLSAFVFPSISLILAIDWLIPGRPITFLIIHAHIPTFYFLYFCAINIVGLLPPLLPLRWAIDWALGFRPGFQRCH